MDETDRLSADMTGQWSIYGRFIYHNARVLALYAADRWTEVRTEGLAFADWAETLSETNPAFHRLAPSIDEGEEPDMAAESGRQYCLVSILTDRLLMAEKRLGLDVQPTFERVQRAIDRYSEHANSLSDDTEEALANRIVERVGTSLSKVGIAATRIGSYDRALSCFDEEERLTGSLYGQAPIYRAAALLSTGDEEAALRQLRNVQSPLISNGKGLSCWSEIREFDCVRTQREFADIVSCWS